MVQVAAAPTLTRLAAVALVRREDVAPDAWLALRLRGPELLERLEGRGEPSQGLPPYLKHLPRVVAGPWLHDLEPRRRARGGHQAPVWDVLELARFMAPDRPSADLDGSAALWSAKRTEPGADGEGRLMVALLQALVAQLELADNITLLHASRLLASLNPPLRSLLVEVERSRARAMAEQNGGSRIPLGPWSTPAVAPKRRSALLSKTGGDPIDVAQVVAHLEADGTVARYLGAFEGRPEQREMAAAVAQAFREGGHLLVEAGTGIGKSLAYLLPAAMHALAHEQRVVVATATTTLQDQLFARDVPLVQAALGKRSKLRATVLKGRANYLCLTRWQTLLEHPELELHERSLLLKTLFWLPRTTTGDRAELNLTPREEEAWARVAADADVCTPLHCSYHRTGLCFLARARRAAEESHLVIANHALLLSDVAARSRVLPEYAGLVVDEAHHLEDEATAHLGWRISRRDLDLQLERLWDPAAGPRSAGGAIPLALRALERLPRATENLGELFESLRSAERQLSRLYGVVEELFQRFGELATQSELRPDDGTWTLGLSRALRSSSGWQEIEALWDEGSRCVLNVMKVAADLQRRLEEHGNGDEDAREASMGLGALQDAWQERRARLDQAIQLPDTSFVYWVSGSRTGNTAISAAPIDVADLLRDRLFMGPDTVVLASATLAVDGSFTYVQRRLGLEDADTLQLGSPFNYREAALVYVPFDLPDPTQGGYQEVLQDSILDTVSRIGGRTLVLFTSRAHLKATYAALKGPLAARGILLLGQGIDEASRTRLLEQFRTGERVVLFGTNAFWEGIDVVGAALSCVLVARLPFSVPTDPVYAARSEQFEDPFGQFAVPQAVLRFKQGFGRLVRSRSDRGVVAVLDRRLVTKYYGSVFLRSLPECSVKQGPATQIGTAAAEWLGIAPPAAEESQPALLAAAMLSG